MSADAMTELFGEPISSVTRAQLLDDGDLVDVTKTAHEAGFVYPVALSRAAWADAVQWTEETEDAKPQATGQDEEGRLWDVLWMATCAVRRTFGRAPGPFAGATQLGYNLLRVPAEGRGLRPRLTTLTIHIGPGDDGEPVVTIMRPGED